MAACAKLCDFVIKTCFSVKRTIFSFCNFFGYFAHRRFGVYCPSSATHDGSYFAQNCVDAMPRFCWTFCAHFWPKSGSILGYDCPDEPVFRVFTRDRIQVMWYLGVQRLVQTETKIGPGLSRIVPRTSYVFGSRMVQGLVQHIGLDAGGGLGWVPAKDR